MSVFFNISPNVEEVIQAFTGRIPEVRAYNEDSTTPRICLATSIDGCLSAVPWGAVKLRKTLENQDKFRVYEFREEDIQSGNLISSTELYQSGKVLDAEETGEIWVVNQELKPFKSYIIKINDFEGDDVDLITYRNLMYCEDTGDDMERYIEMTVRIVENTEYEVTI